MNNIEIACTIKESINFCLFVEMVNESSKDFP